MRGLQIHRNHGNGRRQLDGFDLCYCCAALRQVVDKTVTGRTEGLGQIAPQAPGRALPKHRQLAALMVFLLAVEADRILVQPEQQRSGQDNRVEGFRRIHLHAQQLGGIRSLHR
ncbi:hypothetical protein D3C75_869950 [compost metagenome]